MLVPGAIKCFLCFKTAAETSNGTYEAPLKGEKLLRLLKRKNLN